MQEQKRSGNRDKASRTVLVVGGAGYIGSHMCKLLVRRKHQVIILDDLSTGHRGAASHGKFIEGSYGDTELMESILRDHGVDVVMHFGAKSLVGESVGNPLLYYSANVAGTVALLSAMVRAGTRHFIFSSTAATFGEAAEVPIHEEVDQLPCNPYGMSKLFVEKILTDVDRVHGIRSAILRYFNAAGADPEGELGEDHKPETHLIPLAVKAALKTRKELTVFGNRYPTHDGTCVRDYIHINDLAKAHLLAMEYIIGEDKSGDFNFGTEQGYSVLQILKAIEKVTGHAVPHTIGDPRPGDPAVLIANSAKAQNILGWQPKHDLESIVGTAFEWIKRHPRGYEK